MYASPAHQLSPVAGKERFRFIGFPLKIEAARERSIRRWRG